MTAVALGAGLGLLLVGWLRQKSPLLERRAYALALIVAAAIYLAFALPALDTAWLLVEVGGVALFSMIAWLGIKRSAWWLSVGWMAHVAWDIWLHGGGDPAFVPTWYPLLCAGFDPVVAAAIAMRMRSWRALSAR